MNNIQALIEAEKKATPGEWFVETDTAVMSDDDGVILAITDTNMVGKISRKEGWYQEMIQDAEFIASAKNAMPEIKELVELCRAYFHEGSDSLTREDIERIEQRIRELVQ